MNVESQGESKKRNRTASLEVCWDRKMSKN